MPTIYTWAIIKIFHTTFAKSIAEYNRKLVIKCGQIVYYEIMDIYVTEPFVVHELQSLISDPIMDDLLPNLSKKKKKIHVDEDEPVSQLFETKAAKVAWKEYITDTKHSNSYFADQQERIKNFVNDIYKKTSLFKSKVNSLSTLGNRSLDYSTSGNPIDSLKYLSMFDKKSIEEVIVQDEPYNNIVKTSHVSLVMKKFPQLATIGKSSAIPYKFPIGSDVNLSQLQIKSTPNLVREKKIVLKPERVEKANKQSFETWLKKDIKTDLSHKIIDKWYKDTGYRLQDEEYDMQNIRKQVRKDYAMNPDEKLAENSLFNSIFKGRISAALNKVVDKQKMITDGYKDKGKKFKGARSKLEHAKSQEEISGIGPMFPDITSTNEPKLTLKGASKKLPTRPLNKFEVDEKKKSIENREKLDKIAKMLKKINKKAKMQAREVLYDPKAMFKH